MERPTLREMKAYEEAARGFSPEGVRVEARHLRWMLFRLMKLEGLSGDRERRRDCRERARDWGDLARDGYPHYDPSRGREL